MIVVSDTSAINNLAAIDALDLLRALELKAERVLIDERRGREVAKRLNLRYTGILGVLVEAKAQGLIAEVKPSLDALINQAGFWVTKPLYDSVLRFVGEGEGNE